MTVISFYFCLKYFDRRQKCRVSNFAVSNENSLLWVRMFWLLQPDLQLGSNRTEWQIDEGQPRLRHWFGATLSNLIHSIPSKYKSYLANSFTSFKSANSQILNLMSILRDISLFEPLLNISYNVSSSALYPSYTVASCWSLKIYKST
jgi:hypothetical protein